METAAPHVPLALLLADDDEAIRTLTRVRARADVAGLEVLEAEDGAEAIQLGLQRRPRLALLDVHMPRLGGIEAAITLRELQPQMRVALQTADPRTHRERAQEHRLLLFDKLDLERAIDWLAQQARALREPPPPPSRPAPRLALECSVCGYGAVRFVPPDRCPMCQGERTWIHAAVAPAGRGARTARRRVTTRR